MAITITITADTQEEAITQINGLSDLVSAGAKHLYFQKGTPRGSNGLSMVKTDTGNDYILGGALDVKKTPAEKPQEAPESDSKTEVDNSTPKEEKATEKPAELSEKTEEKPTASAKAKAKADPAPDSPKAEPKEAPKEDVPDIAAVRKVLHTVIKAGHKDEMKALLSELGASNVTSLDPSKYVEFITKAKEIGGVA